jgi:putative isomerase
MPTADTVDLNWRCVAHGEWGLRYWINLCFSAPHGTQFHFDRESGVLTSDGAYGFQLSASALKHPLLVTFHDGLQALLDEYTDKGYFYLGSRGIRGSFAVLRFNLEEAPSMSCTVHMATASDFAGTLSTGGNIQTVAQFTEMVRPPVDGAEVNCEPEAGTPQAALEAIHDVVAWNHVYDAINERSYTVLTRFWNQQKFGGFGIWMNDVLYHALLWSRYDAQKARRNIEAVFFWQTDEGNFPCLVTGNDAWLDRSQPPIVAYVLWCIYQTSNDLELLRWAYPRILANHDWWWRRRRLHATGLVAYGTSLDVGDGLYKGTKLAAKDESSMDNMAVHDPAEFDATTGLLQSADVGLNSLLAMDGEILAQMARKLGLDEDVRRLQQQTEAHRDRIIDWLWDESRGVYANRLIDGRFVQPLAPTSFFPMAAGIATTVQVDSLIENYLLPEEKFGGLYVLPSATRDDPAYQDNVYWRGRIWAPLNYWVYEGLRRYGRVTEASTLASKSLTLFNQGWQERRCGENYHAETGAITDQADTDPFYTWGALLPSLGVKEVLDITPWHGLSIAPMHAGSRFGPVNSSLGRLRITNDGAHWCIECNGTELVCGTVAGRLGNVETDSTVFSADLQASAAVETLWFTGRRVRTARFDQADLSNTQDTVTLPAGHTGGRLRVEFEPA